MHQFHFSNVYAKLWRLVSIYAIVASCLRARGKSTCCKVSTVKCLQVSCFEGYSEVYCACHIVHKGFMQTRVPSCTVSATRDLWEIDEKYKIKIQSATRLNVAKDTSVC